MASLGTIALALALGACLLTLGAGALGGITQKQRYVDLSRNGLYVVFGLIALASAALLFAFVDHDFSIKYVEGRSDTRMPLHYVLSAFYGGQQGSLLFWVLISSGFASAAAALNRDRMPLLMTWFHAVIALGLFGYVLILNFVTPPFEAFFVMDAPADGSGLNPLLQTPLMTIHPPMLLSGLATAIVPFGFGMAALLSGYVDSAWLKVTRRWTLISWLVLGVGNILGGMWAYRELGWGGYWAWDAVENAALVPWLVATAFVHSVIIQEQRGMLKRWNVLLVSAYYLLTLLGTWMTRSGLIDSVHTFAESDVGHFFLAQLVFMSAVAFGLIAWRWRALKPDQELQDPLSREGMFVFNNWLFVGMAAVVLYGTLYPKFAEMAFGAMITYGPPFFNRAMAPLGIILLGLMALGTIMPWRRANAAHFARHALPPLGATVVLTPVLIAAYWFGRGKTLGLQPTGAGLYLSIACFALIVLNAAILVDEISRGVRTQMRGDRGVARAFATLFSKFRRRYGGYIAHVGVLMIFFAFLGNVLKVEKDVTLAEGDVVALANFDVRYNGINLDTRPDYHSFTASMTLLEGDRVIAELSPARFDYNDYARIPEGAGDPMSITSEIYIRSTLLEDVYVTMLNFDEENGRAAFKVEVFPFTMWLWLGGLMLIAGVLVAVWPAEDVLKARYRSQAWVSRGTNVLAAMIVLAPVAVLGPSTSARADGPTPPAAASVAADPGHEGHDHGPGVSHGPGSGETLEQFLSRPVELDTDGYRTVQRVSNIVMTTCSGCAGKTLALASPSCVPTNVDKQRIRLMVAAGLDRDAIIDVFIGERGEDSVAIPQRGGQRSATWLIPGVALGAGLLFALFFMRGRGEAAGEALVDAETDADDSDDPYVAAVRRELASMEDRV